MLVLIVLAGYAPTTAGSPNAVANTATVEPVGTPVPVPSAEPVGTAVPAPSLAPTATMTSSVMPTPGDSSQTGVIVGTSVPSTIDLGSATSAPTDTPASTGGLGGASGQLTVTRADQGKTIQLKVGDRFLLDLGEGYDWTVDIDHPEVVSPVIGILTIRGSQGIYEAHKAGTATLTATGDPTCRQSQPPCGQPSILFKIKILVQ